MPYYIINREPVFLSWQRYKVLEQEATKGKDPTWIVSSTIAGHKESEEKSELMFNVLDQKFREDPQGFHSKWVAFDLTGEEASKNVWNLLYDYCHFYGYASLSDFRDFTEKLLADYEGEAYTYPMGRVFALTHFVRPAKWLWRFTHKRKGRTVQVIIYTN
jgi:hypothetical protein